MSRKRKEQTKNKLLNFTILNMSDDSNKGDLAIIESTVQLIKKCFSKAEINVINCDFSAREIENNNKFGHLRKLPINHFGSFFPKIYSGKNPLISLLVAIKNLVTSIWILTTVFFLKERSYFLIPGIHKKAFSSIITADLVIIKGGSYIYSYGGIKQFLFLYRMLFSVLLSIFLRKKVIALGHSSGPILGIFSMKIAKFCLSKIDKIVVRESISYDFVTQEIGINKDKVELLPDLAFWYPNYGAACNKKIALDILRNEGIKLNSLSKVKVGLTVRKWNFPLSEDPEKLFKNYIDILAKTLDKLYLKYKAEIFIMPHYSGDIKIGEQIAEKSKNPRVFILRGDYSTTELGALYGMMDIFIGTRTHSNIFALSRGTPVAAVAYQIPKGFGIISMVEDDCIVDIKKINEEILWGIIEKIYNEKAERRRKILTKVDCLKREIDSKVPLLIKSHI